MLSLLCPIIRLEQELTVYLECPSEHICQCSCSCLISVSIPILQHVGLADRDLIIFVITFPVLLNMIIAYGYIFSIDVDASMQLTSSIFTRNHVC
jgi:hypothetical protein